MLIDVLRCSKESKIMDMILGKFCDVMPYVPVYNFSVMSGWVFLG